MARMFAASEPKRSPLNTKTTASLRARIEASAAASGRPVAHEVEFRIEQALDFDREFNGREAAEIYHNIGRFLRMFNISAFSDETYLAREGLKAAFSQFIDRALPVGGPDGVGMLGLSPSSEPDPERIEYVKNISSKIADAVFSANLLDDFARMKEAHGNDAPRLGESLASFAERAVIGKLDARPEGFGRRKKKGVTD